MIRTLLTSILFVFFSNALWAFDIDAMNDEEREAFRAEIRAYLLENPEVLMEAIAVLEERRAAEDANRDIAVLSEHRDAIFNDGFSYVGGNPDGDVTMVEFLDYRCGFCKRAHPAVKDLLETDGNIRLIVKEFPILGEQSTLASQYAIATKMVEGDDAYLKVHDVLMEHQGGLNAGFLARTSRELGFDHGKIAETMEGADVENVIASNRALAQLLQIQGTPSFIMGENFVRGFVELDQMRAIVSEIRASRG